jgi:GTPase SAR1 family protein
MRGRKQESKNQESEIKQAPRREPRILDVQMLGDHVVGKTTALSKMGIPQEYFLGEEFVEKQLDEFDSLRIYDLKYNEYPHVIRHKHKTAVIFLMFDLTNQESFDNAKKWRSEVDLFYHDSVPIILIGTKSDLIVERKVTFDDAKEYAAQMNFDYIEISAIGDDNKLAVLLEIAGLRAKELQSRLSDDNDVETYFEVKKILDEVHGQLMVDESIRLGDIAVLVSKAQSCLMALSLYKISTDQRTVERGFVELLQSIQSKLPARLQEAAQQGDAQRLMYQFGAVKDYLKSLKRYLHQFEDISKRKLREECKTMANELIALIGHLPKLARAPLPFYLSRPQSSFAAISQRLNDGAPNLAPLALWPAPLLASAPEQPPQAAILPPAPQPAMIAPVAPPKPEPSAEAKELLELLQDGISFDFFSDDAVILPNGITFNRESLERANIAAGEKNLKLQRLLEEEIEWAEVLPNRLAVELVKYFDKPDFVLTEWPPSLICQLTGNVLVKPVVASNGKTYEKEAIERYVGAHGNKLPGEDGKPSATKQIGPYYPNLAVSEVIQKVQEKLGQEVKPKLMH